MLSSNDFIIYPRYLDIFDNPSTNNSTCVLNMKCRQYEKGLLHLEHKQNTVQIKLQRFKAYVHHRSKSVAQVTSVACQNIHQDRTLNLLINESMT